MRASEVAARGAMLLDTNVPDWIDRIDLSRLNVGRCQDCLLGQLFGSYQFGLSGLGLYQGKEMSSYGFNTNSDNEFGYEELTEAWRDLIARRRLAKTPEVATPA
jgi:hypothetical protein